MCGQEHDFLKTTVSVQPWSWEGVREGAGVRGCTCGGLWARVRGVGCGRGEGWGPLPPCPTPSPPGLPPEPAPSQAEDGCVLRPRARHTELENPGPGGTFGSSHSSGGRGDGP